MAGFFSRIKDKIMGSDFEMPEDIDEGYVELSTEREDTPSKVTVRPFVLEDFADIKEILDVIREGYTVALVNIKPLKDKDLVELKRAVSKLKKTTEAVEGDIAGFGEDWLCICPSFAQIHREKKPTPEEPQEEF